MIIRNLALAALSLVLCTSHGVALGIADDDFDPAPSGTVNSIITLPDGRILAGGAFESIGGCAIPRLAMLNPNGTPDPGFIPNPSGTVNTLLVQADGKIMVGGDFSIIAGSSNSRVARLNPDGTPDDSFRPAAPASTVNALAVQTDGKILIGGAFTSVGGTSRLRFARLHADGALDTGFNAGANSTVNAITLVGDGKILVGGSFTTIGNQPRPYLVRLNSNGSVDTAFNATMGGTVNTIVVQPDGRVVIGGSFTTVGGQTRQRIARLEANGALDTGFNPGADGAVNTIALQTDGKIWVGGTFSTIGGQTTPRIALLDAEGVADPNLSSNADNTVNTIAMQADGKVLTGGLFTSIGGQERSRIARLTNDPAISELSMEEDNELLWRRGGAAPEVDRVEIEYLQHGVWVSAGAATRVADGWQATANTLPQSTWIRARGRTVGGRQSGNPAWVGAMHAHGIEDLSQISVSLEDEILNPGEATVSFEPSTWREPSEPITVTITNTGDSELTGISHSIAGLHPTEFSADALPATTLAPGASMDLTIHFIPSGAGTRTAQLHLHSSDVQTSPFRITLQGSAVHGDTTFTPSIGDLVQSLAVQPDGRILVGGFFNTAGGRTTGRLVRLNSNGTLDESFIPMANGSVSSIALQPDGKILIGGSFTTVDGQLQAKLARLNPDGTLDAGFRPVVEGTVNTICLQSDGGILLGGRAMTVNGLSRPYLARLHPDGTLDIGFNLEFDGSVHTLAVQPDGRILIGGMFTTIGGVSRARVARLNANGTLDTGFNPGANDTVLTLTVQPDGKILAGGSFTTIANQSRTRIARLNPDGTLDTTFFSQASGTVNLIVLQTDGRMLVGGGFSSIGNRSRVSIARLLDDGSTDPGFDPGSNTTIQAIALQADGGILVGGGFTIIGGRLRSRIARLQNEPAHSALSVTGTSEIHWQRGGTAPEVERVAFEYMDGGNWIPVGPASRVSDGWQATGLTLPTRAWLRARGQVIGGKINSGSSGIVGEMIAYGGSEFPQITVHADGQPLDSGNGDLNLGTETWRTSGAPVPITITNNGSAPLTGLSLSMQGWHPYDFSSSALNVAALAPGESTSFTVAFAPSGGGHREALVHILSNDATASPFLIHLSGTGVHHDSGFSPVVNGTVHTLITQADGRVLLGGDFSRIGAQFRSHLARLHPNGTLDSTLNPEISGAVYTIAIQPDQKILLGGVFAEINGQPKSHLTRLGVEGAIDTTFNTTADGAINAIAIQPDQKILLGGAFSGINGQPKPHLARLNPDGTLDSGFSIECDGAVHSIALQPDGAILVGGAFTTLGGQTRQHLARLHADGTLDTTFNPAADGEVNAIAIQPDGAILVGGAFTTLGGETRWHIARIAANGTPDPAFTPAADSAIRTITLQADGGIWIGGEFTSILPHPRSRIARLHADGSVDTSIDPGASGIVNAIVLQHEGAVLAGGEFTTISGAAASRIARVPNDPATSELTTNGTNEILWQRGGTAPALQHVEFTYHDGGTWVSTGPATRVPGGWQATGLSLPASTWIRARGQLTGGRYNGSSGALEKIISYGTGAFPKISVHREQIPLTSGGGFLDVGPALWKQTATPVLLTITNTGDAPLSGLTYQPTGNDTDLFQVNPPPTTTLAPGQSTTIGITFTAIREGAGDALLSIASNDLTASPFQIFIRAVGERCDPEFISGADAWVTAITYQRDGCMLVGGDFTAIAGHPRAGLARIHPDGTIDDSFTPELDGPESGKMFAINIQDDGMILLAGAFAHVNGVERNRIARLHENGTLDTEFNPNANDTIKAMALQPDGKILIGGDFTNIGGMNRTRIARLNPDGTLDSTFTATSQNIRTLALQQDGKILVGTVSNGMARLHPDGTTDTGFNKPSYMRINAFIEQSDGKILVAGLSGISTRPNIIRLNPDGTQETAFLASANSWIDALALQADGRILIGGDFTEASGQPRERIARLNPDGTIDPTFNPGADDWVSGINIDANGKIILCGRFTTTSGQNRPGIARLLNDPATSGLTVKPNGQLDWPPAGTMPSVHRVAIEIQQNNEWLPVGTAERQGNGWRHTGHPLPESATLRFQCRYSGGLYNSSTGFVTIVQTYNGYDMTGRYEAWAILPDLPADRRDRLDTNGPLELPNILAYAMGINPLTATPADLPAFLGHTANPGQGILRFRRNPDSLDTTLQIWTSPNLETGSWIPAVVHGESLLQSGSGWQHIEAIIALPSPDQGFFRWSVESQE
jgi:uncharacterized delta-60 repeat protein